MSFDFCGICGTYFDDSAPRDEWCACHKAEDDEEDFDGDTSHGQD